MNRTSRDTLAVCGLRADGNVVCRGVQGPSEQTFVSMTENDGLFCGVHEDQSRSCWGARDHEDALVPTAEHPTVSGAYGLSPEGKLVDYTGPLAGEFTEIVADTSGALCGLRSDGTVECDGAPLPPADQRFVHITMGSSPDSHICGLRADGKAICWREGPVPAPPDDMKFAQLNENCGLRTDGTFVCWTHTGLEEMPDHRLIQGFATTWGFFGLRHDGVAVGSFAETTDDRFVEVAAESRLRCGTRVDGTTRCWGYPAIDVPADDRYTRIAVEFDRFCGVKTDGSIRCIRSADSYSGFSDETTEGAFASISLGPNSFCALDGAGHVSCTSYGWRGAPNDSRFLGLDYGGGFEEVCGVSEEGVGYCWDPYGSRDQSFVSFELLDGP